MDKPNISSNMRAHPLAVRWWGVAVVALLHGLVLLAALLLDPMKPPNPVAQPAMHWIKLEPKKPAPIAKTAAPESPKTATPPAVNLSLPQFTILAPEAPHPSPPIIVPNGEAPPPERRTYGDLFSADKKEQFQRFFNEQATLDRRENAKAGNSKSPCDVFKKPDDLGAAGEPPNNGVSKSFKPGLVIGTGGSDDEGVSVHACN